MIPGYYFAQVRPSDDALKFLAELNGDLQREIRMLDAARTPVFSMAADQHDRQNTFNFMISANMLMNTMQKIGPTNHKRNLYFQSLRYVEQENLIKNLNNLGPEDLLKHLCHIGMIYQRSQKAYREEMLYIFQEGVMPQERTPETFKQVDRYIQSRANAEEWNTYKTVTRPKLWKQFKDPTAILDLEEKEHEVMKLITTPMADHELVPDLMSAFAEEFCRKCREEKDVEMLMAWVHHTLIEIHPFRDGNGRAARLWMNLVRLNRGLQPLLIDNEKNYLTAVKSRDPAVFAQYLKTLVAKQIKVEPIVSECFRHLGKK